MPHWDSLSPGQLVEERLVHRNELGPGEFIPLAELLERQALGPACIPNSQSMGGMHDDQRGER
jgi:hypothetical protein